MEILVGNFWNVEVIIVQINVIEALVDLVYRYEKDLNYRSSSIHLSPKCRYQLVSTKKKYMYLVQIKISNDCLLRFIYFNQINTREMSVD